MRLMKNKLRIISWNVNGIRAAVRKNFHAWLLEENPDILCVQETKAHPDQLDDHLLNAHDYHSFWSSAEKKGYSGTAIFAKKEPISMQTKVGVEALDKEGRMICLEYEKFFIINVYFPNGKAREERLDYKMDYYAAHLKFIEELRKKGKAVIVCGDYNTAHKEIDLARPKANEKISGFLPKERAWLDEYVEKGMVDTLREFNDKSAIYTWWSMRSGARSRNVGWRIDYFFIDKEHREMLKDAFVLADVIGSDHCPLGVEIML